MAMTTDKRLGEYLREMSGLSCPQVVEALRAQVIARDRGERKRIGEILLGMGFVRPQQLNAAIERQKEDARL